MSNTPRTSEEWRRIQRLPDGRYSSQVTDGDLAHGMCNFAKQLERELAEARKQRDRLVKALEQCLEDSEELLAERYWWKDESRCDYQKDHAELAARVQKAKQALAAVKGGSND